MSDTLTVLVGNAVKFSVVFTDEDDALTDPDVVTFTLTPATGSPTVYNYADSPTEIIRDSVGAYHIWINVGAGEYVGYFAATGNIKARGCAKLTMVDECE